MSYNSAIALAYAQATSSRPSSVADKKGRKMSSASLPSGRSLGSPRSSMSLDRPRNRSQSVSGPAIALYPLPMEQEDPQAIADDLSHALAHVMKGAVLYKCTRRKVGKGFSRKRHRRFFYLHPYTNTISWRRADVDSSNAAESIAKNAYIESVKLVLDPNCIPQELYHYSFVISTRERDLKLTAATKEAHDIWAKALQHVVSLIGATAVAGESHASLLSHTAELSENATLASLSLRSQQ